jgi:UDP-N-acetylglucosamine transferase subunit ALG13
LLFLQEHFPNLKHLVIPSSTIKYPKNRAMILKMLLSSPKLIWGIYKEHQLLKKIIKKHKIDIVISDNRYGLWSKKTHSIFITHQLWIKSPKKLRFAEPFINKINHWFINKYDECWVPDFEGENNLAGELSHPDKKPENIKYIGILSRFKSGMKDLSSLDKPERFYEKFDILAVLSGPEPQRTLFENILIKQISETDYKTLIVQGKPEAKSKASFKNIQFKNHLNSVQLIRLIIETNITVCRSGYSSLMDLIVLNKNAILVPTPGQTEQEYLAASLSDKNWFCTFSQNEFQLEKAIEQLRKTKICCKFEKGEFSVNYLK